MAMTADLMLNDPYDEEWPSRARCRGQWASVDFFASDSRVAKGVCAGCPVWQECLLWALVHEERGVWGGTTENDRTRLRKQRRQQTQPPPCVCGCPWTVLVGSSKARCVRCQHTWPLRVGLAAVAEGGGR